MQSLMIGVVAVLAGVVLGYFLGKTSAQAEGRLHGERIAGLEAEKATQSAELRRLQDNAIELTGMLRTAEAQVAAEKNRYTQMQADIDKTFGDLAARALSANNQSFLTLAKQELGGQNAAAKQALDAKETAIKNLLDPLGTALKSLDAQAREMEIKRAGAYFEVKTLVENIQNSIPASLEA